jgi:hypothetical protein
MQGRTERAATGSHGAWSVRAFDPERDADAVSHLDTSYTSGQAYAVHRSGDVVALAPTAITAPHSARGAIDPGPNAGSTPLD